jgi:small subunit ribosomal protein S18
MSEQENPTATEPETDVTATSAAPAAVGATSYSYAPPAVVDLSDNEDDDDDDDIDDDDDGDDIVRGPGEYAPHERSGRSRRIGSDVRFHDISYKNIPLLSRFLDGRGRILSRRKTRVTAKVQRRIVQSIKRARHLALLPYTSDQNRIVRKRR